MRKIELPHWLTGPLKKLDGMLMVIAFATLAFSIWVVSTANKSVMGYTTSLESVARQLSKSNHVIVPTNARMRFVFKDKPASVELLYLTKNEAKYVKAVQVIELRIER